MHAFLITRLTVSRVCIPVCYSKEVQWTKGLLYGTSMAHFHFPQSSGWNYLVHEASQLNEVW